MARKWTGLRWPAAAVLALVLGGPAALAQGAPGKEASLLDRYRIHPSYDTGYDVNRDQKTWRQKLALDRRLLLTDFKGQVEVLARTDERRNDLDQNQRKLSLNAERRYRLLRLYARGTLDRDRVDQTISSRHVGRDNLTLGAEATLFSRGAASLKLKADGGLVDTDEINIRRRSVGYIADSTQASGVRGGAGMSGSYASGSTLKFSGDVAFEGARKQSKSYHTETGLTSVATRQSATDRDEQITYNYTGEWTRFEEAKVQTRGAFADGSTQFYQASLQGQETKVTQRRDFSLLVDGQVTPTLHYGLNLTHKLSLLDYELDRRDRRTRDSDLNLEAGYTLAHLPILSGSEILWAFAVGEGEVEVENANDYRTERAQMSGEVNRPLGTKLALTARGEIQLTQDFYDDPVLDQDVLIERFNVSGRYTPSDRFRSTINYRIDTRETILISSEVSAGNQLQEDYAIVADYAAQLPAAIQIKQSFQVQASYQTFVYSQEKNSLARTNRVVTALDIPFWTRTLAQFRHDFLKTDSGAYIYSAAGGGRAYARGIERVQQKLQVTVKHDLTREIYVKTDERYEITYSETVATGAQNRIDKLNFTWEVGFQKQFPSGFKVSAVAARTASTQEDSYWNIRADAGMKF